MHREHPLPHQRAVLQMSMVRRGRISSDKTLPQHICPKNVIPCRRRRCPAGCAAEPDSFQHGELLRKGADADMGRPARDLPVGVHPERHVRSHLYGVSGEHMNLPEAKMLS